jgi:hypothetical protein
VNPKQDCTRLMNSVVVFAKKMLQEHGEFRPYGGYLTVGREIVDVGVDLEDKVPAAVAVQMLAEDFQGKARTGVIVASAIVFMVNIRCPDGRMSDAIQVNLDHQESYSAEVFYPFTVNDGKVTYEAIFAQAGSGGIFSSR